VARVQPQPGERCGRGLRCAHGEAGDAFERRAVERHELIALVRDVVREGFDDEVFDGREVVGDEPGVHTEPGGDGPERHALEPLDERDLGGGLDDFGATLGGPQAPTSTWASG